jgi:hypothetical protein
MESGITDREPFPRITLRFIRATRLESILLLGD